MSSQTSLLLGDVREEIEEDLEYGDHLAEWIRDACRIKLELKNSDDPELEECEVSD